MADGLVGTKSFTIDRMVRYLSQTEPEGADSASKSGLLAIDLGGGSIVVSAGLNGKHRTVVLPTREELSETFLNQDCPEIHRWTSEPVSRQEADQFLCKLMLEG